jgi:hypothetical protein
MYQIARQQSSPRLVLSTGLRDARTRRIDPFGATPVRWNAVTHLARKPVSRARLRAEAIWAWFSRPFITPIMWRMRTFNSEPLHTQTLMLSARLDRDAASAATRARRTEAMLESISESLVDLNQELAATRAEVEGLRRDAMRDRGR